MYFRLFTIGYYLNKMKGDLCLFIFNYILVIRNFKKRTEKSRSRAFAYVRSGILTLFQYCFLCFKDFSLNINIVPLQSRYHTVTVFRPRLPYRYLPLPLLTLTNIFIANLIFSIKILFLHNHSINKPIPSIDANI
jgi:hypothetical protein